MGAGASSKKAPLRSLEHVDSMITGEFRRVLISKLVSDLFEQRQKTTEGERSAIKDEVKRLIHEYLVFLWLRKLYPKQIMPASKPVDIVWHQHIIFTREYAQFCQRELGSFLHHTPNSSEKNGYDNIYSKLLVRYKYHMKSEPPEQFWPQSAAQKERRSILEKQMIEFDSKVKFMDDDAKVSKPSEDSSQKSTANSSSEADAVIFGGSDYAALVPSVWRAGKLQL